jgi:hypothetical protein
LLGALITVGSLGLTQLTSAQTPTPDGAPTDTPSPDPSPSPTPFSGPTSTITIRFLSHGQPVTIHGNRLAILADGVACNFVEPAAPYDIGPVVTSPWPLSDPPPQPLECTTGPPTLVRFEFASQFGVLFAEFPWTGTDVTVDIHVQGSSVTPTSSPVELPSTGKVQAADRPPYALLTLLLLSLLTGALAPALLKRRRERGRLND